MIEWLERRGLLFFHPSIKTARQKVHALIYASFVVFSFVALIWVTFNLMGCTGENTRSCSYACKDSGLKMKVYDNGKCECQ